MKIVCFHGFNNDAASFAFMTKAFRERYADIADFYFINGPVIVDEKKIMPEGLLTSKGFNPPFRSWFIYDETFEGVRLAQMKKKPRLDMKEVEEEKKAGITYYPGLVYDGVEAGLKVLEKAIAEHGPFDGALGFSQGCWMIRGIFALTQVLHPEKYKHIQLPSFVISFSGAVIDKIPFLFDGKLYDHIAFKHSVDSMLLYGTSDPFFEFCGTEK